MFILLILIGIGLIGLGIYRDTTPVVYQTENLIQLDDLVALEKRIENIENNFFQKALEVEEKSLNHTSDYALDKYKLLIQHEKEGLTIDEISTRLNMNKGEVLLLKNLYKNY